MDNGMEGMLDTYLFETNSLLDRLDEMLMADEKIGDFSTDDVNEIFRYDGIQRYGGDRPPYRRYVLLYPRQRH